MKKVVTIILLSVLPLSLFAEDVKLNEYISIALQYEKGFVKLFHHTIQIGEPGTEFDYLTRGGQEILFPFERFSADLYLFNKNKISFLYQPLTLQTTTRFYEDVTIDTVTFPADTIVNMKYGFPFYRLTYAYLFHIIPNLEIGTGLAFQLRNASITFGSENGTLFTSSQNLGPVPALHVNARYTFSAFYLYFEATGLYASSAIINGADFEFEGSILDTSLRIGVPVHKHAGGYVNARFIGGSAKGTSEYENAAWSESRERYTANYLATGSLTLGLELTF
jgi:hypothetical protein